MTQMPLLNSVGVHDEIYFKLVFDNYIFLLKLYIFILIFHQIIITDHVLVTNIQQIVL